MAIGLKDLRKIKEERQKRAKKQEKETTLRPWHSFNDRGMETRTLRAKEAIGRAREIVEGNNNMVSAIRNGIVPEEDIVRWEMQIEERQELFEFRDEEFEFRKVRDLRQTKTGDGILSFFKDLF